MRVIHAMAGAEHGGAEGFFERLVPALGRAGVTQRVLIRTNAARAGRLREAGVADLHELSFGGRFDLRTSRAIRRHLDEFHPDVLFTWMSRATIKAPRRHKGYAHVARLGGYYDLKYYQACDLLIGDTEGVVDYIEGAGWPRDKAVYLPNFVAATPGKPIPRAALGVPEDVPLLLALGRLHDNKGYDTMLRALARLPGAWLMIGGEGPEREALETLAAELGVAERVRFLGWRGDVADLFATADLFVHAARVEALGNVILEAWAHGVPVVASAAEGPAGLIGDGVDGLLVPVDDPAIFAVQTGAALAHPDWRERMAAAGRKRFETEFAEAPVVAKYLAFFEQAKALCAA